MERTNKKLDHVEKVEGEFHQGKLIQFHYTNGEKELFGRINGGIAWPTLQAPAYFCIFAQMAKENQFDEELLPLVQIFELEDTEGSINNFFNKVKEAADRFMVHLMLGSAEEAYSEKFNSMHYSMLLEPTGAKDFNSGLEVIKAWSKGGGIETMENSILRSQLASLRESELKEASEKFNAINGMRHAVCGFDDEKERRYCYPAFLEDVFV
jgi:hypothetical protein